MPEITLDVPDELLEAINTGVVTVDKEGNVLGLEKIDRRALVTALLSIKSTVAAEKGAPPAVKGDQIVGYYVGQKLSELDARLVVHDSIPHAVIAINPGVGRVVLVEGKGDNRDGRIIHCDALELYDLPGIRTPFQPEPPAPDPEPELEVDEEPPPPEPVIEEEPVTEPEQPDPQPE